MMVHAAPDPQAMGPEWRSSGTEKDPISTIYGIIDIMAGLYRYLPQRRLSRRERRIRALSIGSHAVRLVNAMATVLEDSADLFDDIDEDPADLRHLQRCAGVFRTLSGVLLELYE